jgi:Cytochrome c554 and c-prime
MPGAGRGDVADKSSLLVLNKTGIFCNVKIPRRLHGPASLGACGVASAFTLIFSPPSESLAQAPEPLPGPTPAIVTARTYRNVDSADFIGAVGCSSSICHGGGPSPIATNTVTVGDRNAYTIWQARDAHAKSWATLATERSARMAAALGVGRAQDSSRCTECHAPMQAVNASRLGPLARVENGISCESCHGPAKFWIRSHTRKDLTHAQNVTTGLRDLESLYVRANTCIACHQVLPSDLQKAGHPPLVFELDAQSVAEPKHWKEPDEWRGPQAWLVGQAAALREMSWALNKRATSGDIEREQWRSLLWLMRKTTDTMGDFPKFDYLTNIEMSPGNLARAQATADDLARAAAGRSWDAGTTRRLMETLAASDGDFTGGTESSLALQNRAVRLTLALSRLLAPFEARDKDRWAKPSEEMQKLFLANDARVEFDSAKFVSALQAFQKSLAYAGPDDAAPKQTAAR